MLNSIWGKLSQRANLPRSAVCTSYFDLWKIINNDEFEVVGEVIPNDNCILLSYQQRTLVDFDPDNTSVAICSFVTAYVRLHLYTVMETVYRNGDSVSKWRQCIEIETVYRNGEDRLLKFDTDSVNLVRKLNDVEVKCGNFFGDLNDEIKDGYGEEAICRKFVSGGPKNYGLEINTPTGLKPFLKAKGIRADGRTLQVIKLQRMVDMVKDSHNNFKSHNGRY